MARPGDTETIRIRKLYAALDRAKADGLTTETISAEPMCSLLGVKIPTLREWLDDDEVAASGAFIRGGRGTKYEFNPVATIWVLIRYFERLRDAKVEANRKQRELIGGDKFDGAPDDMTLREVRDAVALRLSVVSMEQAEGQLVPLPKVKQAIGGLLTTLRDATLAAPQELDPTNTWSPEERERFDHVLAKLLLLLQQKSSDYVADARSDGSGATGADGTGKRAVAGKGSS